ncbi:hnRNP A1-gamma isoform [Mycena rebaudengoi]|nr:hnRNP A1-gamma isoform [Mycena rebaudengoi]
MSKATGDDLYGGTIHLVYIYGDDDNEFAVPETTTPLTPAADAQTPPVKHETHHALPPKPTSAASSSSQQQQQQAAAANAAALSYSAQIAQQFSAYQQTPSQERQQRAEMSGRAQQQQQQQQAIPTHSAPTYSIASSEDTVFGKKPSEMHDAGNYFSEFGKVDACTIMRDPAGTSRGFAFMTFEDPAAVATVLGREHFLDGKAIDPKRAIPREEHLRNTRYFVGGLAPATTSESMKEFFSAYGKVVDATVMVDRESSRSKGFGFVTFEDATNADQLVGKLGLTIDDKEIEVKMAQPRSQRDQARGAPGSTRDAAAFNDRDSRTPPQSSMGMAAFVSPQQQAQQQQMSMMYGRQMPGMMGAGMMGGGMGGMNPMAMMGMGGMGMGGFGPMGMGMGGMGGAGMGMGGMGAMGGMGMGGMRMGMPMGGAAGMGVGMGGMGMGAMGAAGMGGMGGMGMGGAMRGGMAGGMNNFGRMVMGAAGGTGPARTNTRGQHNFHPYSR